MENRRHFLFVICFYCVFIIIKVLGNNNFVFYVKTGVKQGFVKSVALFNLIIDCVTRKANEDGER